MSNFVFKNEDFSGDVFNANQRFIVRPAAPAPVDKEVSRIVGREILATDPRLIQLVVKWKQEDNRGDDITTRNDYLYDAKRVNELKDAFK